MTVPIEKKARQVSRMLGEPDFVLQKRLEVVAALHKIKQQRESEAKKKRQGSLASRMAQNLEISAGASEQEAETEADGGAAEYLVEDFEGSTGRLDVDSQLEGGAKIFSYAEALSLPEFEDFIKMQLTRKEPEEYLRSLALFEQAAVVLVEAGSQAKIRLLVRGAPLHCASFFLFGADSSSELFCKTEFSGAVQECRGLILSRGASVHSCFVQTNQSQVESTCGMVARLGESAQLKFLNSNLGGSAKRDGFLFLQDGRGSRCEHFEASLAKGNQRLQKESDHVHLAPDTYSRSFFKYATDGYSQVNVNGRVTIEQTAPGSDTHLLAKSLLLSEHSVSKVTPMLFVRNSDVAAGHGSAMTPLQDEELFYLRSRGIGENESRLLVLQGFLGDLLHKTEMDMGMLRPLEQELMADASALFPRD